MPRNKPEPKIKIKQVAADKSKIKFKVTLEGEWDWNKDFADRGERDDYSTLIDEYQFRFGSNFKQSLLNYVWGTIQDSNLFNTAVLSEFDADKSIIDSWEEFQSAIGNSTRLAAEKKLKDLEEQAANLRESLAK